MAPTLKLVGTPIAHRFVPRFLAFWGNSCSASQGMPPRLRDGLSLEIFRLAILRWRLGISFDEFWLEMAACDDSAINV